MKETHLIEWEVTRDKYMKDFHNIYAVINTTKRYTFRQLVVRDNLTFRDFINILKIQKNIENPAINDLLKKETIK
jgi:hypothetical protein